MKARAEQKSETWYLYTYLDVFKSVKNAHVIQMQNIFSSRELSISIDSKQTFVYISIKTRNTHPTGQILGLQVVMVNLFTSLSWGNISRPQGCPHPSVVLHQGFLICLTASGPYLAHWLCFPNANGSFFGGKVPPKRVTSSAHQKRHLNCCVPWILTENLLEHHKEELAAPGTLKGFILIIDFCVVLITSCHILVIISCVVLFMNFYDRYKYGSPPVMVAR